MRQQQLRQVRIGRTARALAGLALMLSLSGCFLRKSDMVFDEQLNHFQAMASQAQYPEVEVVIDPSVTSEPPQTLEVQRRESWYLSPEEAVQMALANSPVLRELGGQVLYAPYASRTIHNPAIVETDPRFGVEAALSAFDAEFFGAFYAENNDYVANNEFLGGGTNKLRGDYDALTLQLSKRAATGTEYYLRHNLDYTANNAPGNLFPSVYNVNVEAEFRHPLFQGGGVEFNRIAGPGATPGNYNGVVIARINADVSLIDFELGVRDLVNNVENAYWDLYFAYRDLEAKVAARELTRLVWEEAATRAGDAGRPDLEPQAREQYFRYQEEVQNALSGRVLDGTRSNNGSSGGTFRGWAGVQVAERRLRLLMGAPINDHQMIVPTHEPFAAEIVYDWSQISGEAVARRAELRRQRLMVRRREMELFASRNFLLPRMDAFGRYRYRGFGDKLLNPDRTGLPEFDNAYMELTGGEYQEWRVGAELRFPIGFRQAHAGVRNAQLLLAREKSVLLEQERQVIHDLSNSVSDVKRAYAALQAAFNRHVSAQKQVEVLKARKPNLNQDLWINAMLDALQRLTDSTLRYQGARVEYILAIKNLHLEKGSLLEYNNIFLAENLPAVVAPSNGAQPPAEAGEAGNNPAAVRPGPAAPGIDAESRSPAAAATPAGTPQVPPTTTAAGSPQPSPAGQRDPTPVAADLRASREAARAPSSSARGSLAGDAPGDAATNTRMTQTLPGVTWPPLDRRPRPSPQAGLSGGQPTTTFDDPSVAVPRDSASVYEPGATSGEGAAHNASPPPATDPGERFDSPPPGPSSLAPQTPDRAVEEAPAASPARPAFQPPVGYVPPAREMSRGGSFGDPSLALPHQTGDMRAIPAAPALASPPAKDSFRPPATAGSTPATAGPTPAIRPQSPGADAVTGEQPAARVAARPGDQAVKIIPVSPLPPRRMEPAGDERSAGSESSAKFGDPSVIVPSTATPRIAAPPFSSRRQVEPDISDDAFPTTSLGAPVRSPPLPFSDPSLPVREPSVRRLPATRSVVPASREAPL